MGEPEERHATREEAAAAAATLLRCNGWDLDVWSDGLWPIDALEALTALAAISFGTLKLADVSPGDILVTDAGFTCIGAGKRVRVQSGAKGELYFACSEGGHMLDGQLNEDGTLAGLKRVAEPA